MIWLWAAGSVGAGLVIGILTNLLVAKGHGVSKRAIAAGMTTAAIVAVVCMVKFQESPSGQSGPLTAQGGSASTSSTTTSSTSPPTTATTTAAVQPSAGGSTAPSGSETTGTPFSSRTTFNLATFCAFPGAQASAGGCPYGTAEVTQVGGKLFTYAGRSNGEKPPYWGDVVTVPKADCDHVDLTFALSDRYAVSGATASLRILQEGVPPLAGQTTKGVKGRLEGSLSLVRL
jgi:hypothetical protein